ncbi:hypothetical protein [Bradyrhizobium sp.]|uniref:hypothetical protein n=1 Tax=Bradyrhizobium sp. TaxID=376 RepID=UPI00261C1F36|nr:hypothetical protein [Bradyrhizobium sp.]
MTVTTMRLCANIAAALMLVLAPQMPAAAGDMAQNQPAPAAMDPTDTIGQLKPEAPDTDLFALMTGKCSTLKIAGHDFACRTIAYAHSVNGRAYFTIALDDPADQSHIISFSGGNGQRTKENLYDLAVDQVLIKSKHQPKADGLPVPAVLKSAGRCVQLGSFATLHISSVVCSATDTRGKKYELRFESDGSPITVRRVNPSAPTIREHG